MANPQKVIPSSFGPKNLNNLLLPVKDYRYFQDWARFPFNAAVQGHSPINAWWLAECSLLAYETPDAIRSILASVKCFDADTYVPLAMAQTGLSGFCIRGQDFSILSFRGTEFYRPEDILRDIGRLAAVGKDLGQDIKLLLERSDGPPKFDVEVVRGFCQPLQSIWPTLASWLSQSRNLWLTGHSLGGALAALTAFQVPERVAGLYTFGCPCPAGKNFTEQFNDLALDSRSFRYVHGNDLVAKGLDFPGSPYRHVGMLCELDAGPRKNILERVWNKVVHRDLTDHAPLYYALHTWNKISE